MINKQIQKDASVNKDFVSLIVNHCRIIYASVQFIIIVVLFIQNTAVPNPVGSLVWIDHVTTTIRAIDWNMCDCTDPVICKKIKQEVIPS